jgi:hypothetical protein
MASTGGWFGIIDILFCLAFLHMFVAHFMGIGFFLVELDGWSRGGFSYRHVACIIYLYPAEQRNVYSQRFFPLINQSSQSNTFHSSLSSSCFPFPSQTTLPLRRKGTRSLRLAGLVSKHMGEDSGERYVKSHRT